MEVGVANESNTKEIDELLEITKSRILCFKGVVLEKV